MNYCTYCDKEFTSLKEHLNSEEHIRNSGKEHEKIMKKVREPIKATNPYEYYKNIKKYHDGKIPEEKNNKGNKLCPLCKVRVGNLYQHQFSALHRHNVLKDSVPLSKPTLDDFKAHFHMCHKKMQKEIIKHGDDPFWVTAEQELDIYDYELLKEYMYGRKK